ncbi:YlbG family protein [Fructilactobacillus florum]|uniref:YlbG family protein n=1 Tax=Fructilactobacillus florum TaxID=640331 RepID=UPI00028D411A|nr:YlbG family protein [Fructilactobacillus florum]EKK20292.1 hypothetical protein B807_930 [Fructilactobacillus florum 2F]
MSEIPARTELVIGFLNQRSLRQLAKFGDMRYASLKMHYAIMYVNQADEQQQIEKIKQLRGIKSVAVAPTATLAADFAELNQQLSEDSQLS